MLASVGTDGTDGPLDAAVAVVDVGTVDRLEGSAENALQEHEAYTMHHSHSMMEMTIQHSSQSFLISTKL